MTHLMASTILLFPHPLGPTTPLMPLGKDTIVFSENDLKPLSSNLLSFTLKYSLSLILEEIKKDLF
jgi:hypothetical protein